jgi:glycosyltransferase involved in cell wall biosynthesis
LKILFLSNVLPYPLDAGPKVRAYYVLRALAQKHDVTLISFTRPSDAPAALAHLREVCAKVVAVPISREKWREPVYFAQSVAQGQPYLITRDMRPEMFAAVRQECRANPPDVIHADQLSMAAYALEGAAKRRALDEHNAVWRIVEHMRDAAANPITKIMYAREARLMRGYEREVCRRFDHVFTVNETDRAALELDPARSSVTPICIDPAETPAPAGDPAASDVVFVGNVFYPPNVDAVMWFAREVWPAVRQARPAARFVIVGARPAAQIATLAAQDPRIMVRGYVPDLAEVLRGCAAFIAPIRAGAGMRVKILDAWARGVPVVSTALGAEGIEVSDGDDILLANAPAAFADAVMKLLSSPALRHRLAQHGRAKAQTRYNWRERYQEFLKVLENLTMDDGR